MVFGLFARKPTGESSSSPEAKPEAQALQQQLRTPSPSIISGSTHSPLRRTTLLPSRLGQEDLQDDTAAVPPMTPSPPPLVTDTAALYDLMLTIPPKTLHAYTLAHLKPPHIPTPSASPSHSPARIPAPPTTTGTPPPSPRTLTTLTGFFASLAPPPQLHCVRCHKDFFDVENDDRSCLVPHDDESALVERVGGGVGGGAYETLWGCCGQTVEGDGDMGPPDGWCYEGKHTTDTKRARFRADSTIHEDKLTSCLRLNCHNVRDQLPSSSNSRPKAAPSTITSTSASRSGRNTRKRARKSMKEQSDDEIDDDDDEASVRSASTRGRPQKAKGVEVSRKGKGKAPALPEDEAEDDGDSSMAVDEPEPEPKPERIKSKPLSKAKAKTKAPPSKRAPATSARKSHLSQSHIASASESESSAAQKPVSRRTRSTTRAPAGTKSKPRTRSTVREESRVREEKEKSRVRGSGRAESRARLRTKKTVDEEFVSETDEERGRKKRRVVA
ncbi:hypothetical protein BV22DRAFT_1037910 [Leucogyrophana mollusca]|uniref:Uncharacterized protein n=1 Tax=Leucogyrophana mollusca TaxID=85980 RepID=A0ACB8BB04_9AGAM|nr:hypothetical protein BV22DRAFT_1037910 [Leucogyrophana mollusca]